jgi:Flp pilus assembly pilin Flp
MFYIATVMLASLRVSLRSLGARFDGERGQDLIEYALLSGLIAAALVAVFATGLSSALTDMVTGISNCIDFKSSTVCSP